MKDPIHADSAQPAVLLYSLFSIATDNLRR